MNDNTCSSLTHWLCFVACCLMAVVLTVSCGDVTPDNTPFVINEVMASNRTGLMAEDGNLYDWIELRNVSDRPVSLEGYILAKDSCRKSYNMPDTVVQPGCCVLVYATKSELPKQLHCNFKLSSKDEQVQLYSPRGTLLSEVSYDRLHADQSLRRDSANAYSKTYHPTPGFDNTTAGYQNYLKELDRQKRGPILIWEFLKNGKQVNCNGNVRPVVELKNVSSDSVLLSDYKLGTRVDGDSFVSLPGRVLAPGELFSIVDSAKLLSSKTVVLLHGEKFVDGMNIHKVYPGVSMQRQSGRLGFLYSLQPSIGAENQTEAYDDIARKPRMLTQGGANAAQRFAVSIDTHGCDVHYTTDGTAPTMQSPVYRDSILIDVPTTVRAIAFSQGRLPSEPVFTTYLPATEHSLPVVFITADADDLFDPVTGIYSKGPHAESEFPYFGANYWHDWERPAHIEFYDSLGSFSYDCGIKIFGGFSRALDKKSFQIKFRSQYGQGKLEYPLFDDGLPQEFHSLVLRSGSQDIIGTMVRDEFFTSLLSASSPTLLVQSYRPVVLYLNREYYGVYFIREKINKHFVARHLGTEPDSTQLLMQQHLALYGTSRDYIRMVNYAIRNDVRDSLHYNKMAEMVDFESLIDFKLGEFYACNTDAGNIRFCRSTDPRCNQKWHWIYYDLDASFMEFKTLDFYIRGASLDAPISSVSAYNVLCNRLLSNPSLRRLFLARWAYHLEHTFKPDHALQVFDRLIQTIEPEMLQNCLRWPQNMTFATWQKHVSSFRNNISTRLPRLNHNLIQELNVTPEEKAEFHLDF